MSPDDYLRLVLDRYPPKCNVFVIQGIQAALEPSIRGWAGPFLRSISVSGSNAKGTAVGGQTDVDFFVSVSQNTPETLPQVYSTLFNRLQQDNWAPRAQNVSIGVRVMGFQVDVVPGRAQAGYTNRHSLYRRKVDSWTQTNVTGHINLVRHSGRTEEIRLAKIWRQLNGLEMPSLALELAVLRATHERRLGALAGNFWEVLRFLAEDFASARLVDPENTANVVSSDLTATEKADVAHAAVVARTKTRWVDIVY
jgi:hypothetical protein